MARKDRSREGELRCLNCFARFRPALRAERAVCATCGMAWRISLLNPAFPKIRGPVWDEYPKPKASKA